MASNIIHNDLGKAVKLFNRWQFKESAEAFSKLVNEFDGAERVCFEAIAELSQGFFRIWKNQGGEPNAMVGYIERGWDPSPTSAASTCPNFTSSCLNASPNPSAGDAAMWNSSTAT